MGCQRKTKVGVNDMNNKVVNEISELIAKLQAKRTELDEKIRAAELTLETYLEDKELSRILSSIDPRELEGLKQYEALKKIATLNGGVVRVAEAKRLLLAAGLSKARPQNLVSHIHNLLKESDEFEWESRGTFRLVPPVSSWQPAYVQAS